MLPLKTWIKLLAGSALMAVAANVNRACGNDTVIPYPISCQSVAGSAIIYGYSKYANENQGSTRKYLQATIAGNVTQAMDTTGLDGYPYGSFLNARAFMPETVVISGSTATGGMTWGYTAGNNRCPPDNGGNGSSGGSAGFDTDITNILPWFYPPVVTDTRRDARGLGSSCRWSGAGDLQQNLSNGISFSEALNDPGNTTKTTGHDNVAYMTSMSTTTPGSTLPIYISGEAVQVTATFAGVCPDVDYDIVYSYASRAHGSGDPFKPMAPKIETHRFTQDPEDVKHDIEVDKVNIDYTITSVQAFKKGSNSCPYRESGSSDWTQNSVHGVIKLGHSNVSGDDVRVLINQDDITPAIYTPQDLQMTDSQSADIEVIPDGTGALRQVKTPQGLVDVVTLSPSSYQINFYYLSQVGAKNTTTGLYAVSGATYKSCLIQNPDATNATSTQLKITETSPTLTFVTTYAHDPVTNTWTLDKGGLRTETMAQTTDQSGNLVKTITITGPGQVPSSVTAKTYQNFPWGQELVKQVDDPAGAALTTTWTYYTNSATDGSNYGLLRQKITPSGYWETYAYDAQSRRVQTVAQFGDSAPDSPASANRVTNIIYTTIPDIDGDSLPENMTTTVVTLLGQEISRSYEVIETFLPTINGQATETRLEIQCTVAGAAWNDPTNLVTNKQRIVGGSLDDRPVSQLNPDRTLTTYAYTQDATTLSTTSFAGAASSDGTTVTAGTETTTVTTLTGQLISSMVYDYDSSRTPTSTLLSSQNTTQQDSFGRPTEIDYLDGTHELFSYACCGLESDTDREGIATNYNYNGLGYVTSTTRAGISLFNTPDPEDRVLNVTRMGTDGSQIITTTNHYDLAGRMDWTKDALGRKTAFAEAIDGNGHTVKTTTYPDGGTHIETYFKDGSLLSVTGTAAAQTLGYTYGVDAGGAYTQEIHTGNNGGATEWIKTYTDIAGRNYKTVHADGATEQSSYNNLGQLVKQADADGVATLFAYNAKGEQEYTAIDVEQTGQIDFSGTDRITQTHRDVVTDHSLTVQRTTTTVWTTANSGNTQVISTVETTPEGRQTWQTAYGLTTQTKIVYNGNGARTATTTAPDGTVTTSQYQNGLLMSQAVTSLGTQLSALSYFYDVYNRLQTATDARTGATTYAYFDDDQIHTVTLPAAASGQSPEKTIYGYDSAGRQNQVTQADGGIVTTNYYPTGQVQNVSGARTYPVAYTYDSQGRMKTMTTWQDYTNTKGAAVTTWNYDPQRGWLTSKLDAIGQGPGYTYYPSGRLKTRTWARGIITSYGYNTAGDLAGSSYSDSTPSVGLTYDRLGRLLTTTDAAGLCTWAYDPVSYQVLSESYSSGLLNSLSVGRTFDSLNRLGTTSALSASSVVNSFGYGYDSASRLQTVTSPASGGHGANTATYGYLPNSNLVQTVNLAKGGTTYLATTKAYDNINRLSSINNVIQGGAKNLNWLYGYNNANQRTQATREDASYWKYGYDNLGQVTSGQKFLSGGTPALGNNFGWTFDSIGNRQTATTNSRLSTYSPTLLNTYIQRTVPGTVDVLGAANAAASVVVNQQDAQRQGGLFYATASAANAKAPAWLPLSITGAHPGAGPNGTDVVATQANHAFIAKNPEQFYYDADGNLTADGRWIYAWDAENRLASMQTQPAAVAAGVPNLLLQFAYDAQGRRIDKKVSTWNLSTSTFQLSTETKFLYDGWNLIAELNGVASNAPIRTYTWGLDLSGSAQGAGGVGGLLAVNSGSTTYAPAYDGNGNIISLINAADGSDAADFEYDPFGNVLKSFGLAANAQPFGFSTKYQDAETGLLYYGQRYYNPGSGRWLSRDPIEEEGGINLYVFTNNDSINQIDFIGNKICSNWRIDYKLIEAGFDRFGVTVRFSARIRGTGTVCKECGGSTSGSLEATAVGSVNLAYPISPIVSITGSGQVTGSVKASWTDGKFDGGGSLGAIGWLGGRVGSDKFNSVRGFVEIQAGFSTSWAVSAHGDESAVSFDFKGKDVYFNARGRVVVTYLEWEFSHELLRYSGRLGKAPDFGLTIPIPSTVN